MGEEPPLQHHAEHQPGPFPRPVSPGVPHSNGAAHPPPHNEEEPYTIRCICGFADDDGNTVLCEQCETWQHIECYYHPTLKVPDVHKCVECLPRILDSVNAAHRQRRLREGVNGTDERKARRAAAKTHKRSKTKDPAPFALHQVNGVSHADKLGQDRASGSPRDQPPPSKRPKTSHRHSGSAANNAPGLNAAQHGRSGSNAHRLASPVKLALADCPPDYFSSEFINVHQSNTDFTPAQTNLFLNIGVSDSLSTWLDDPEAFAQATHGKSHADVFKQHPTPIEELETPVQKCVREDTSALFHGNHPVWPYLVADRDLFGGDFVGELIGSIGHLQDYKADPVNNWDRLRHPDHFVFFHPHLPIYIDCRTEGTMLRYARRSCRPNIKMETIITGAREYHFCFIATCDISEGAELTVAWDLESDPQLRDYLYRLSGSSSSLDESQRAYLIRWVETVLAHFGDCACPSFDGMCLMERFDHRVAPLERPVPKASIQRKRQTSKRSPSRVAATASAGVASVDSRAGSEARLRGDDEEMADSASSPRSSRSRTSREVTPSSYDLAGRGGPELSERDKKKLLQQEKLFQKIEQEEQGQRKKKRRSGSTLNTPSAATFKQPDRSYFSASNPDTPALGIEARPLDTEMYFNSTGTRSPIGRALDERSPPRAQVASSVHSLAAIIAKPVYADASAQTECEPSPTSLRTNAERRPYVPLSQRLLRRNHLNRLRTKPASKTACPSKEQSPTLPPAQSMGAITYAISPHALSSDVSTFAVADTKMGDKLPPPAADAGNEQDMDMPFADDVNSHQNHIKDSKQISHESSKPSAPPWPTDARQSQSPNPQPRNNYRATNFHVDLPPPQFPSVTTDSDPSSAPDADVDMVGVVQSPQSTGSGPASAAPIATMSAPMLTPNHANLMQPSPIKKKMSLSDYSQRLKSKTPNAEKTQSIGQAGSTSPPGTGNTPSSTTNASESTPHALLDPEGGAVKREHDTPQL